MVLAFMLANGTGQLVTVHDRHVAIGDHQIKRLVFPCRQPLLPIGRDGKSMSKKLQLLAREQSIGRVIVDYQNIQWGCGDDDLGFDRTGRLLQRQRFQLQQHLHLGTDARLAAQLQAAAHHLAEIATDHQPQPCASPGRLHGVVGLSEGFEQALLILFADPDTTVVNLHPHLHMLRLRCRVQVDNDPDLALLGKLDGIADQIGQHLLEAQWVQQHIESRVGR
ncbi:hypothetical protein D3C81_1065880 [compost metagenome]